MEIFKFQAKFAAGDSSLPVVSNEVWHGLEVGHEFSDLLLRVEAEPSGGEVYPDAGGPLGLGALPREREEVALVRGVAHQERAGLGPLQQLRTAGAASRKLRYYHRTGSAGCRKKLSYHITTKMKP